MRKLMIKILINIIAFYCATLLFPVIQYHHLGTLLWAGLILGLINILIRPFIFLITLPFNFLTLGLFTILVNTWMVMLTNACLPDLKIPGFWWALFTALVISAFNIVLQGLWTDKA